MVKRSPVQIDNLSSKSNFSFDIDELINEIKKIIFDVLNESKEKFGILLSGGVDSSVLALLTRPWGIPCFTIGKSIDSPDVCAAMKLAEEKDISLYVYIPNSKDIEKGRKQTITNFPGDENVLIALKFASKFVSSLLATDGIDELMGGYWWHVNRTDKYPTIDSAFEHFWNQLEPAHLTPMFEAAKQENINIYWVYLQQSIMEYIARLSLEERIKNGNKSVWKEVAKKIGVPQWIIDRPKRGFLHALN